ncbi:hypothetical protein GCM10010377_29720 [Streptomyces viridiviolaceus]|uniref:Uncharacterized protein n=1 Tax=Streptomyces viridiviolaceus TaxID=68282 RepID=A0ABW2EAE9_9ACTN|nr:hypothetical protein [Streptomyces viridiviolaceus]GHB36825.1 hypothetical protein GCM10010377_29720 [Streptomyces viridiviolaceus]
MTELIGRIVTWVSLLFDPRGPRLRHPASPPAPQRLAAPDVLPLPSHRSPYGLPSVLDGAETVSVRPYVVACRPYGREAA